MHARRRGGCRAGQPDLHRANATTLDVVDCGCIGPIVAHALTSAVHLAWRPVTGAASYDIYRSSSGRNRQFVLRGDDIVTNIASYVDRVASDGTYWYRITPHDAAGGEVCGSSLPARAVVGP